jgi:Zn finger protein HypA/HybF involved in hydrogenase expression
VHELTAIAGLVRQANAAASEHGARRLVGVTVQVGALSHLSATTLERLFPDVTRGTALEGAWLRIETCSDIADPDAAELMLVSVDVED